MTDTRQLSDGASEGQILGQSATDKISFYGADPVVQPTAVSSSTATATSASTTVNAILTRLRTLGLIAS